MPPFISSEQCYKSSCLIGVQWIGLDCIEESSQKIVHMEILKSCRFILQNYVSTIFSDCFNKSCTCSNNILFNKTKSHTTADALTLIIKFSERLYMNINQVSTTHSCPSPAKWYASKIHTWTNFWQWKINSILLLYHVYC